MKIGNIECYGIIYKITNLINRKIYIGQTVNSFKKRYDYKGVGIERVYNYHMACKKYNKPYNDHIVKAIEKYGFENWEVIEIFDVAFSKGELDIKEKHYISIYNTMDRKYGYNNTEGGANGKQTEEVRRKHSETKKGKNKGKDNPKSKMVICITTNEIFDCLSDASNLYNLSTSEISGSCKGKRGNKTYTHAGKLSDGTPLVWRYYEDYLNMTEKDIQHAIEFAKNNHKGGNKSVICITTGKIFKSAKEAGDYYGITNTVIIRCCKGKCKSAGKLNGEKLIWEYYIEN